MTQTMMTEFNERKVINRIAQLKALGLSDTEIALRINKELKPVHKLSRQTVKSVWSQRSVRHKEFAKSDKRYAEMFKEALVTYINEVNKNISILNETRGIILKKLEQIKTEAPGASLMAYSREIANLIRTQNDSLRTMSKQLEHLESQQKEVKVNQMQNIKLTMKTLKTLEDQGVIEINPDYKNTELFDDDR